MSETVLILSGLLAVGFLTIQLARSMNIPHSVFLVIIGGAAGLTIRAVHPEWVRGVSEAFPGIILYVLLPPLIFESAYNMDFSALKKDVLPITVLAVIGLIISAVLIGSGMHLFLGFPLMACLLFGAFMSATDPVAVVALFKELGAPKRLTMLVEGESLFNDGSAIVLFQVLLAAAMAPAMPVGAGMVGTICKSFIIVFFGGVLVGLVIAVITSWLLKMIPTGSGQMGMTVAAAYLSFIVADHVFHVSGVMSTVPVGLYLGNRARLEFNKEALHGMHYLWEFLALAANIIVFFGVGLTVEPKVLRECLKYIPAVLFIAYAARTLSVVLTVPVMNRFKMTEYISGSYQGILIWGGLRGGLALALVLLLQDSFEYKQLFLGLATSVVLATLLINALTIKTAMKLFGLSKLTDQEENLFMRTIHKLQHHLYPPLFRAAEDGSLSNALVNRSRADAEEALKDYSVARPETDSERFDFEFRNLMLSEKSYYDEKLEDGILSKTAYRRLIRIIQQRFDAYWTGGNLALFEYKFPLLEKERASSRFFSAIAPQTYHKLRIRRLTRVLEECLHLRFAIREALTDVEHEEARKLADGWLEQIADRLHYFFTLYPSYANSIQSLYIANTLAASAEKTLDTYMNLNLITGGVYARARQYVEDLRRREVSSSRAYLNPSIVYLLKHVPLFSRLPDAVLVEVAAAAKILELPPGAQVVREGEAGDSIYLLTAGMLKVTGTRVAKTKSHKLFAGDAIGDPTLLTGDFFGEMSLLRKAPRSATVTTVTDATIVEISYAEVEKMMGNFPEVRKTIEAGAQQRMAAQTA